MIKKKLSKISIALTMKAVVMTANASPLLSHSENESLDINAIKNKLVASKTLTLPLDIELSFLDALSEFDLGRFLLANRGLNGYWTSYVVNGALHAENLSPMERWLVYQSPAVKATRERYGVFQNEIKSRLRSGISMASIPSGLMDDLIDIDYSGLYNVKLTGIDLDPVSLDSAKKNAETKGFDNTTFINQDAWHMHANNEYDLIASNGLNIYEPSDERVVELYVRFFTALRKDGVLITSFLTPPPFSSADSPWINFNPEDALKQKAIFGDIIGASWQTFRTEEQVRKQLKQAGFEVIKVIYDSQGMFPTVIAQKRARDGLK